MAYGNVDTYDDGQGYGAAVAHSPATERAAFVQRTYGHLAGAVLLFAGIEAALFASGFGQELTLRIFRSNISYLLLMVAFIGGGFLAQAMANSARSRVMQYAGLALYIAVEVVVFLPILYVTESKFAGQMLAAKAGIITLCVFSGLTAGVFVSGKDFSFLGPILWVLSFAALGVIIASIAFGFSLGIIFPALMVVLAAGFIVYDTSNVMHRYRPDQHVAASLALFASVVMMFYYVLRLLMGSRSD